MIQTNKNDFELDGSETKTFYWFRTEKGEVTIRWYGSSNGYYSESVNFVHVEPDDSIRCINRTW